MSSKTSSSVQAFQQEEERLLKIKERLNDQLRRLQVEELALRSMLQSGEALEQFKKNMLDDLPTSSKHAVAE